MVVNGRFIPQVAANGWVFLGERHKFVRVSRDRITRMSFPAGGGGGVTLQLRGSAGETVSMVALQPISSAAETEEWRVKVLNATFTSDRLTMCFGATL